MRISTASFLFIFSVFFLGASLQALAQPVFTIQNRHHTCGPAAAPTGSFDIVVTAADLAATDLTISVIGGAFNYNESIPIASITFPFTRTITGLTGTSGGRTYFPVLSDTESSSPADGINPVIFNFTATTGTITHNTNPGCATPNGAITVNLTGNSSALPFVYSWVGPGGFTANTKDISGLRGGDYTLTYRDSNSPATTCSLGPIHVNDPAPTAYTISTVSSSICENNGFSVDVSSTTVGYTYEVMEGATSHGSAAGTGGAISISVPALPAGPHTLRVRASQGTCPAVFNNAPDLSITVNPAPDYNNHTNTAPGLCSGQSLSLDLNTLKKVTSVTATSFVITNIASGGLTQITGSATNVPVAANEIANDVWKNTTNGALDVVYTINTFAGVCPGNQITVTFRINPEPAAPNITKTICSSQNVAVNLQTDAINLGNSIAGTTFSWSAASNVNVTGETTATQTTGTIGDVLTNTTSSAQTVVYTVTPTSPGGCQGSSFTVTVTVNLEPTAPNITKTICSQSGVNVNLQTDAIDLGNAIASTTFVWTAANNASVTGEAAGTQTTTTINDVLVNTSSTAQQVVYTVTPTSPGGCQGAPFTVTVTVDPEPVAPNITKTICSGANVSVNLQTDAINLGNSIAGTTFSWVAADNVNITGEAAGAQTTGTISDVLVNKFTSAQNVVYTVTPTSPAGCVGAAFTVTITVNPEPVAPNVVKTICSTNNVAVNLQTDAINLGNSIAGTTFSWVAADNTNVSGESAGTQTSSSISDVLVNTSAAAQVVVYTVTPTSPAGCQGSPFTVSVTVNLEPVAPNITKTICSSFSVLIDLQTDAVDLGNAIPGTTFSWVAADNTNVSGESAGTQTAGLIGDVLVNTTLASQNVVYTVTPTSPGGCPGNPFTVTVTVNPEPVAPNITKTICSAAGVSVNLQTDAVDLGNAMPGTTFSWVAADNTNVTGESSGTQTSVTIGDILVNKSTSQQVVVYTVTPSSPGACAGTPFTVTVTVNPEPEAPNITKTICSDNSVIVNLQTDAIDLGNSIAGTTFSWVATDNVNVTGESVGVQTTATIGDVLVNTTASVQTVTYTVTPTSPAGCQGSPFTVTITVNLEPVAPNITKTICSATNTTIDLQADAIDLGNAIPGTTFSWVAADNTNVTGESTGTQTSASISDILINQSPSAQQVVYTVTPTSPGGCPGNPFTVTITIDPEPVAPNVTKTVCSGVNVAFNLQTSAIDLGNSLASTTFSWVAADNTNVTGESSGPQTAVTIGDVLVNLSSTSQVVVYTVTPTSAAGCAGNQFTVTVTVNPEPFAPNITKTICTGDNVAVNLQTDAINLGNSIAGTTFSWVAADNTNVTGEASGTQTSSSITDVLVNATAATEIVVYTVTPTSPDGCLGAAFTVSVSVSPRPVLVAGQAIQVCSGSAVGYEILLNPANLPAGTTFSWPDPDGAGPATAGVNVPMGSAGTTHINDVLINIAAAPLVVTYVVTPSIGGACTGTPQNVVVTVNRAAVANAGADQSICTDAGAYTLTGTSVSGAATTGTWSFSSQPGGGDGVITPLTALANPATATFTATVPGDYVLALTTDDPASVCGPAVDLVTITVTPIPVIAPGQTKLMCGNDPVAYEILMTPANLPANTVFNWPDPDGSGPAAAGVNVAMGTPGTLHLNDILINNGTTNITVTYVITPSVGLCVGTPENVVVTVRPSPVVALGQTKTICSGDLVNYEILLSPANTPAGTTFSWPDPDGSGPATSKLNVPAGPVGTLHITDQLYNGSGAPVHIIYSVISKGANGCTGVTRDIDIVVNSGAIVEAGNPQSICSGGTATLGGASIGGLATNGTWTIVNSPAGGDGVLTNDIATVTPATSTFKASVAGDYTLQLTTDDPAGSCSAVSDVVVITVKSPADPSCTGGTGTCATVVVTPIPSPATCNNSDGGIVFDIVPAVPIVNNTGVRIDIVGTGPTNLTISRTNFNDYDFAGLPTGVYNYTIEYGDPSCIKTGTVTIDRSGTIGTPTATNLVDPVCFGPPFGTATIDAPGETGHQLEWSVDALTWTPFIAGQPVTGLPGGTNIVSVRRDASDPCASGVVITLANPTQITATFAAADATCANNDGTITVSGVAGGTGPYTYTLNGTAVNLPASNVFNGLTANTYTIAITDSKGCTRTFAPVTVSFPGYIAHTAPVTTAPDCAGAGGNGKVEFTITDPGSFQFALTTDLIVEPSASQYNTLGGALVSIPNLANNSYAIWIKPLGAGTKCATKVPVTISGVFAVSYAATTSNVVCFGQPTAIQVSAISGAPGLPYNYRLTNTGDNSVSTGSITAAQALSTYSITGVGPGSYSLVLTQDQTSLVPSCTLPISGGAKALTILGPSAALDSLYVKRAISFPDLPSGSALVGVKPSGLEPYEVRLELTSPLFGAQEFVSDWSEVEVNPQNLKFEKSFTNLYAGGYTLGIRDAGGCVKTYLFTLGVDTQLFIPNIFTPNGDGSNEVFYIRNLPADANLLITNRWGKEVYKSAAYQNDWNGGDAVDGVYYYTIKLDGQSYTGWVEILRGN